MLRGRLLGLARDWGQGGGPLTLLACPPGELHDLGLICFGLALRARGWRIAFLGTDTPIDTLTQTADHLHPELVVLTTTTPQRLSRVRSELRRLSETTRLAVAGAGTNRRAGCLGRRRAPQRRPGQSSSTTRRNTLSYPTGAATPDPSIRSGAADFLHQESRFSTSSAPSRRRDEAPAPESRRS